MFKEIPDLLTAQEVETLRGIAAASKFVDGRITNPHNKLKQNLQLHEAEPYQKSSQILLQAFGRHEDFRNFAFPAAIAPPLLTRYAPGMHYGAHADNAFINLPTGAIRSDLSSTIFLSDPQAYDGGALIVRLGDRALAFKGGPGSCIVYPSHTLHQVEPVTSGERLVAITFMQSKLRDPFQREVLYELGEVAALEGLSMQFENRTRLNVVIQNLTRAWSEKP